MFKGRGAKCVVLLSAHMPLFTDKMAGAVLCSFFFVVPAPTIEQRPAGSQGPGHFLDRAGVLLQETTLISFQTATAANNQHHVWRSTASQICRACFKPN